MATQWASGPLHPQGKVRVFLLQEVLFALHVHLVGVGQSGHYTAQEQAQDKSDSLWSNK